MKLHWVRAARPAMCTAHGNTGCWMCTMCGRFFRGAEGKKELICRRGFVERIPHKPGMTGKKTTPDIGICPNTDAIRRRIKQITGSVLYRERKKMKKTSYFAKIILFSVVYVFLKLYYGWTWLGELVTTVLAFIAAVTFWIEYKQNERINEAQLVMELNDQFISNPAMTKVEWELERYYVKTERKNLTEEDEAKLRTCFHEDNEQRQNFVNYLVHLEGVAALVNSGVLHLPVIDNLMAYRYFLAVNNPVVQQEELLKFKDYYQGIIRIYDKWSKSPDGRPRKIPLEKYSLSQAIEKYQASDRQG